jgi:hypothetical protein
MRSGHDSFPAQVTAGVVTVGKGRLATGNGAPVPVGRGGTVLSPHAAHPAVLTGAVEGVRCLPAVSPGRRRDLARTASDETGEKHDVAW